LAGATERLEQAFKIAQRSGDLTVQRLKQVYLQLTSEAEQSAQHEQLRQQVVQKVEDYNRRLRDERRLLARVKDEDLDEHISELETKLVELRLRRDNLRRAAGSYEDDLLSTYLTRYATRKGIATMAATTRTSHMALVTTISHFAPATRIQDVDEAWLVKFQDWLVTTPSKRAIYRRAKNPDYGELDERKLLAKEFLYYKETSTRKNSSVSRYIERVKGCLRYYQARPHLLPPGVVVSDSYKLYEFDLAAKEDNVVALEEAELFELFASVLNHNEGKTFPTLQQLHTSVNYSGAQEVVVETARANAIGTHSGRRTFINICLDYNDVKKHMRNIFQLPAYEAQEYVPDDLVDEVDGLDEEE
nr:hypothetical protein [Tanacetum cinerariifolium]